MTKCAHVTSKCITSHAASSRVQVSSSLCTQTHTLILNTEFFGRAMDETEKVFHGLNKIMNFQDFTAYFNQVCCSLLMLVC